MRSFATSVKTADIRAALRVGASMGIPLMALYASGSLSFAVYAAMGAFTSLYGNAETARRRTKTQIIVGASMIATIGIAAIYAALQGPSYVLALLLVAVVLGVGTLGALLGWIPRGEMFFVLALMVISGIPIALDQVPIAIAAGAAGAGVSIVLTSLGPKSDLRLADPGLRDRLRAGSATLDRRQHAVIILTVAVGTLCAWVVARWLDIGHAFWAPVMVTALMPALVSAHLFRRMGELMLGTGVGVCLAAALYSAEPGTLVVIAVIASFHAVAVLFVARHFAIALVFITPLAIGMSNLGRGLPWGPLVLDRLVETALGLAVAVATILIGRVVLKAVRS